VGLFLLTKVIKGKYSLITYLPSIRFGPTNKGAKAMKQKSITRSHHLKEELLEDELELVNRAMNTRKSHMRSIDELDRREAAPKQRKNCTTKKRPFRDKKEADRVLHFIMNNRREAEANGTDYRFVQFRSYLCPCGAYHHSSKPDLTTLTVLNAA
jgi:hypothetical protein